MRKLIGFGAVLGSVFAVWACSSSSSPATTTTTNPGDSGASSSGSSGDDGSTAASDSSTPTCSQTQINALLASYGVDAGTSRDAGAIGSCAQSMCSSEMSACSSESCQACGEAIGNCVVEKCALADASLPTSDANTSGTCDAPGPECAALSKCCTGINEIAGFLMNATLTSYGTMCTTNSTSCNESLCMQTITSVNSLAAGTCTPP